MPFDIQIHIKILHANFWLIYSMFNGNPSSQLLNYYNLDVTTIKYIYIYIYIYFVIWHRRIIWWSLFWCLMRVGFFVLQQITFAFTSCHSIFASCIWFIFGFLTLLSLSFPYYYHILSFLFFSFLIFSCLLFGQFDECLIFSLINESFLRVGMIYIFV